MKRLALLSMFAVASAGLFAADMTREAKAEKILDLTNARAMQEQVLNQIKQMAVQQSAANMTPDQKAKASEMQARMFDLIGQKMNWDKLRPMMVKVWAETFTDEELDGILNFYQSPAGRAMLQKMPTLMMKSMQQMQGMMAELQPEIEKIIKEQTAK